MPSNNMAAVAGVEEAGIESAIHSVENLYRAVTGAEPPAAAEAHAPIPVEKDPARFVEEQLDRLLALLEPNGLAATAWSPSWSPLLSVLENETELTVLVDLPGVEHKDAEVVLEGTVLTIRGRRASAKLEGRRQRLAERPVGFFQRQVLLSPTARFGEPKAQLRDGVLEIRIAKEAAVKTSPRAVPIH